MLTAPEGSWLSTKQATQILSREEGKWSKLELHAEASLALVLLLERAKGGGSEWSVLIDSFPEPGQLDIPNLWEEEQLSWLRGSRVYKTVCGERDAIREEWQSIHAHACQTIGDEFATQWLSYPLYAWAVGIIDSKTVEDGLGVLHTFSRAHKGNTEVREAGGIFAKRRLELLSTKDIEDAGDVVIGDGRRYRDERIMIGDTGGEDRVWIKFDIVSLDSLYEDKMLVVEQYMEDGDVGWFNVVGMEGKFEPQEELVRYLRLVCLTGVDAFLLEGVFASDIWEILDMPVSPENEAAVCDLVTGACEDMLEEYYEGEVEGRRSDLASQLIAGEKRVVEKLKTWFIARRVSVDTMEYYAERRLKSLDLLRPVDESEIVQSDSGWRAGAAFDDNYV